MSGFDLRGLRVEVPGLPQPVLDIPDLALPAGSRVAVTGASGSGKTTLLNLLSGLARASSGAILWAGQDLTTLSEGARDRWRAANVGLVMQDFHLFPGMSAAQNVALPTRLARWGGGAAAKDEARRLLARVGLADQAGQRIETLSRGQMQRVAVARALMARPKLLIADEPTASLDAEAGAKIASLLVELADETGAMLIVASHDIRLVGALPQVLLLDGGRLGER